MTPDLKAPEGFKFPNVSCSQCGQDFGPGDHGFSHCADHNVSPDSPEKPGGSETAMTDERIAQIEKDASGATPGPWKIWGMQVMSDPKGTSNVDDCHLIAHTSDPDRGLRTFNATFICTARTAVPELIAEVARLKGELAARDALIGELKDALGIVLNSATPNKREHPRMHEAWKIGGEALRRADGKEGRDERQ